MTQNRAMILVRHKKPQAPYHPHNPPAHTHTQAHTCTGAHVSERRHTRRTHESLGLTRSYPVGAGACETHLRWHRSPWVAPYQPVPEGETGKYSPKPPTKWGSTCERHDDQPSVEPDATPGAIPSEARRPNRTTQWRCLTKSGGTA